MHLKVECPNKAPKELCAVRQQPSKQNKRIKSQIMFLEGTVSLVFRQSCGQCVNMYLCVYVGGAISYTDLDLYYPRP